jgi:hypothetical protein
MTFFSVWIFWIMLNVNETCSTQQNIILMNCSRNVELLVFASWMAANSSLLGTLEHGRFFLLAWLSCDVGYGQQQCHSLCGSCFSKSHQCSIRRPLKRDGSYIEKSAKFVSAAMFDSKNGLFLAFYFSFLLIIHEHHWLLSHCNGSKAIFTLIFFWQLRLGVLLCDFFFHVNYIESHLKKINKKKNTFRVKYSWPDKFSRLFNDVLSIVVRAGWNLRQIRRPPKAPNFIRSAIKKY